MNNIVVIPVYKNELTDVEKASFCQCCKVLAQHPICLLTFAALDCSMYYQIAQAYDIDLLRENFDGRYFRNVTGYNSLMLTKELYQRFATYEYMLIYQLDAWVFRDELDEWCMKGYNIIGAPIAIMKDKNVALVPDVYNGGFSLRKPSYCISILNYKGPLLKPGKIWQMNPSGGWWQRIKNVLLFVPKCLGFRNNVRYLQRNRYINEDLFFNLIFNKDWGGKNIFDEKKQWLHAEFPPMNEAVAFAFEMQPRALYNLNHTTLPFGCHAWEKYDKEFWKSYIMIEKDESSQII